MSEIVTAEYDEYLMEQSRVGMSIGDQLFVRGSGTSGRATILPENGASQNVINELDIAFERASADITNAVRESRISGRPMITATQRPARSQIEDMLELNAIGAVIGAVSNSHVLRAAGLERPTTLRTEFSALDNMTSFNNFVGYCKSMKNIESYTTKQTNIFRSCAMGESVFISGARRSGKTMMSLLYALYYAMSNRNKTVHIVHGFNYDYIGELRRYHAAYYSNCYRAGLSVIETHINNSNQSEIRFSNGSIIKCTNGKIEHRHEINYRLEQESRDKVGLVIFDECSSIDARSAINYYDANSELLNRCQIIITKVIGDSWGNFQDMINVHINNCLLERITFYDMPFITSDRIADICMVLNEEQQIHQYGIRFNME